MDFEKIAQETLDFNSKATEVHITSDGVPFLTKGAAKYHILSLTDKKIRSFDHDGEILPEGHVDLSDESSSGSKKPTAAELIESINLAESLEDLDALLPEGENRKTVLSAYEVKKAELEGGNA